MSRAEYTTTALIWFPDHTLAEGHQLALILYGIDAEATQRPDTVTRIMIDINSIDVKIPIYKKR